MASQSGGGRSLPFGLGREPSCGPGCLQPDEPLPLHTPLADQVSKALSVSAMPLCYSPVSSSCARTSSARTPCLLLCERIICTDDTDFETRTVKLHASRLSHLTRPESSADLILAQSVPGFVHDFLCNFIEVPRRQRNSRLAGNVGHNRCFHLDRSRARSFASRHCQR